MATSTTTKITPDTLRVLKYLREEKEATAKEIGEQLELPKPAGRLNALMRAGLVAHTPKTGLWSITPAGESIESIEIEGERKRGGEKRNGTSREQREQLAEQASRPSVRPGSMTAAMLEVTPKRGKGITAKDATAKILEQGLAPNLKGKTPDATVGAKYATESKKADGLFKRVSPGHFVAR